MNCRLREGVKLLAQTSGPSSHFFGYYDKSPLNADETRILVRQSRAAFGPLDRDTGVALCQFDLASGRVEQFALDWERGLTMKLGSFASSARASETVLGGEFFDEWAGHD